MALPMSMYGRKRKYDGVPPLNYMLRNPTLPVVCECGWSDQLRFAVPYEDYLGRAACCPKCGRDIVA